MIDADGLYWLSKEKSPTENRTFFITPHTGEALWELDLVILKEIDSGCGIFV